MEDILYTVKQVATLLHTNTNYVYSLIGKGYLPALKLGSYKVRKNTLNTFLETYEGYDMTDLSNIKNI